jgi:hypothetical protein
MLETEHILFTHLHLIDDSGPCHDATENFPCLGLGFMGGISQPRKRNPALVVQRLDTYPSMCLCCVLEIPQQGVPKWCENFELFLISWS